MATSYDLSRFPPTTSSSSMYWIQGLPHPTSIAVDNTTGLDLSSSADNLTCDSWSSTSGMGLAVFNSGMMLNQYASCSNSLGVVCAIADGNEEPYEFAGFSTATRAGNAGYFNMTEACRDTYGSDARMASSEEIAQSNLDVAQTGVAWVQGIAHSSDPAIDAISGIGVTSGADLTCKGWSNSGSLQGLIVDGSTYSMSVQPCYQQSAVACSVAQ
jgi:hypothetical protein